MKTFLAFTPTLKLKTAQRHRAPCRISTYLDTRHRRLNDKVQYPDADADGGDHPSVLFFALGGQRPPPLRRCRTSSSSSASSSAAAAPASSNFT